MSNEMTDFDQRLKALVDAAFKKKPTAVSTEELNKFNNIHRNLNISSVTQKINSYDNSKHSTNKKYKTYREAFALEVDIKDQDQNLDEKLDTILQKKLAINVAEELPTEKLRQEVILQQAVATQREQAYLDRTQQLRHIIKKYDDNKKMNNIDYKNFEEVCINNEIRGETDKNDYTVNIEDKASVEDPYFNV